MNRISTDPIGNVVQPKKKLKLFNRPISDLPKEVVWQILCRVPIKKCLTCKLVCKNWYKIITSSRFAELCNSSCSDRIPLLFHCYWTSELELIHPTKCNTDVTKFKSKFNLPHRKLRVVNVCNGLVCIKSNVYWGCLYICNLLTSQCVVVEQPEKWLHTVRGYGLGFCSVTRKYKVIRILNPEYSGKNENEDVNVVEILNLDTDKWRNVGRVPNSYSIRVSGTFINDSLHWYSSVGKCILAFHFGTEKVSCIPVPDVVTPEQLRCFISEEVKVTAYDSCLCFVCQPTDTYGAYEVWLMKEYGVRDSWVRQFSFPKRMFPDPYVPLVRMKNGKILISRRPGDVAFYNPETSNFTSVSVPGDVDCRSVDIFGADFFNMLAVIRGAESQGL